MFSSPPEFGSLPDAYTPYAPHFLPSLILVPWLTESVLFRSLERPLFTQNTEVSFCIVIRCISARSCINAEQWLENAPKLHEDTHDTLQCKRHVTIRTLDVEPDVSCGHTTFQACSVSDGHEIFPSFLLSFT